MTSSRGRLASFSLLAALALAGACSSKDKQSLVLVELRLDDPEENATVLESVTLSGAGAAAKTFPLTSLSIDTAQTFGLYFDGSVTGDITIYAVATPASGCTGFRGNGAGTIDKAGDTITVSIFMTPDTVCAPDGGAGGGGPGGSGGGAGGAGGGAAGSGGRGGSGPVQVPSLNNCREFDHVGANCPNHTQIKAVAISPDGQTVATGGDSFNDKVKIWRFDGHLLTATGTMLTGHSGGLAFSPDGTKLAVLDRTVIRLWNTSTWTAGPVLQGDGSNNDMVGVAFTPNGQRVISADHIGFPGGTVYVHGVAGNGLPMLSQHVAEEPSSLSVSPVPLTDGSSAIAVGTWYGTVHTFTLGASAFVGPAIAKTNTAEDAVWVTTFSPDGLLLATGDTLTRFWVFPALTAIPPDVVINYTKALSFSPDGKYVASGGSDGRLSLLAVSNHAEMARKTFTPDVDALVFAPNGGAVIGGEDDCGKVFVCAD